MLELLKSKYFWKPFIDNIPFFIGVSCLSAFNYAVAYYATTYKWFFSVFLIELVIFLGWGIYRSGKANYEFHKREMERNYEKLTTIQDKPIFSGNISPISSVYPVKK